VISSRADKAPEGWSTPRRCAFFNHHRVARSVVLDCGSPLPLFSATAIENAGYFLSRLRRLFSFLDFPRIPPFHFAEGIKI
jgi:hypothetical protein